MSEGLKLKILIITDNVAPYRVAWAEELATKYQVTVAFFKQHDAERNDEWLVRQGKKIDLLKLPAVICNNHSVSMSYIKYYKKINPDIVIFDGYGIIPNVIGILYMNHRNKRFFINVDGIVLDAKENILKTYLKKKMFKPNTYFLCSSEFTMTYLEKYGAKKDHMIAHNFSSIHSNEVIECVPSKAERNNMKEHLGLKSLTTVLAVGRFLKLKQFDMLIEAFKSFDSNNQLVIIGEGPEKVVYEDLIKKYKLMNVKIIDFMPIDELKKYYFASNIFVLPSYSEVWGLVINEAMGYGALPVIASDRCVAGYSLVKNQGTGYQFHYNNVEELKNMLKMLLSQEERREEMSRKSLELGQQYTIENMANIQMKWFDQIEAIESEQLSKH